MAESSDGTTSGSYVSGSGDFDRDTFVEAADGTGTLTAAGVDVVVLDEFADRAKAPNGHLL